ncbi:MAG: cobalt-precorrin-5B (C(1))-methyltransferase CbiD [Pleurocapsa sp.]
MSENPGYTLPVFACASAIAAWQHLQGKLVKNLVQVNLIKPPEIVDIAIEQTAKIEPNKAIAITRSDPGEHLDITRHTPIWALVELKSNSDSQQEVIEIKGGEGVGKQVKRNNQAAIYSYARELIKINLQPLLKPEQKITVTIILPEGKQLAQRTSNAAFGIAEGLSLLGTTGIVQPLTAPSQLEAYQQELKTKADLFDTLVFCIGENGVDFAQKMGIEPQRIVKTANWLGSMLVTAAIAQVKSIVLFGYHGKLIKLAGGIFHTHNHLADGRLEIFTSYCARLGLTSKEIQQIFACPTTEDALNVLRDIDRRQETHWEELIYDAIAQDIDRRCQNYIRKYTEQNLCIGSVLFDRQRKILKKSQNATLVLSDLC